MESNSRSSSNLSESILQARQKVESMRTKLFVQHQEGSPGIQVCNRLTNLMDDLIVEIFENAIHDLYPDDPSIRNLVALIPHGGYGRQELSPYSDLDLMLLHEQGRLAKVAPLAKRLVKDISDLGVDLGFSLRTIGQCLKMSSGDPIILTSLVESRHLTGNMKLFGRFTQKFKRQARRYANSYLKMIEDARRDERGRYGESMHLLEPNVKRSKGGLRDLQLLRWVGFVRYGMADPNVLRRRDLLDARDYRQLRRAKDFLLRLRNELHFESKSERDTLIRSEQKRIAQLMGFEGEEGVAPVERFMQQYFTHTSAIRNCVGHFVAGARWHLFPGANLLGTIASQRIDGFLVGPVHIRATKQELHKVTNNLTDVLRLFQIANQFNRRIDHPTWEAIREAIMSRQDLQVDKQLADQFLALLSHTSRLGKLLRRLHELRVLEKLVPGFDHARCLLQFNEYHKYTVDEHSIRAVESANEFQTDDGVIGSVYREIEKKSLFHLALLVHDLGKGFVEDHSEVGARIAEDVARHLYLSSSDCKTLVFLVHKHLMLSHLAFRRNSSDEELVRAHAKEIGSPERLRMLFVLTCADFAAVGPDVLNQWKVELLTELYFRIKQMLEGTRSDIDTEEVASQLRTELIQRSGLGNDDWIAKQIEMLPLAFLEGPSSDMILDDLKRLEGLDRNRAVSWGRFLKNRQVAEFSIGAYEDACPGAFHRITGALTGKGLEILSAEIHNLADGLFLDRFYVHDGDYVDEPPVHRFDDVTQALEKALTSEHPNVPTYRRQWGVNQFSASLTNLPTKVKIKNFTSRSATVIEIITHDKPGLLHTISQTLFELHLSVSHAKIGTYLDQVVDVFYVTDSSNNEKIEDENRVEAIRTRLLQEITEFSMEDAT